MSRQTAQQSYEYHISVLNDNLRNVTARMLHLVATGQITSPKYLELATSKILTEKALRELEAEHKEAGT